MGTRQWALKGFLAAKEEYKDKQWKQDNSTDKTIRGRKLFPVMVD